MIFFIYIRVYSAHVCVFVYVFISNTLAYQEIRNS